MEPEQLAKLGEELQKGLHEVKGTIDQLKKDNASDVQAKLDKQTEAFTAKLQEMQDANAKLAAALERPGLKAADESAETKAQEKREIEIATKYFVHGPQSLTDVERKAMSTDIDAQGGYFIPKVMAGVINGRMFETTPMLQLANVMNVSSKSVNMILDDNEVSGTFEGEASTLTEDTTADVGMEEITAKKGKVQVSQTSEILEDAEFDVQGWLEGKISDKLSRLFNTAFVTGDGVKRPRGFMTYPDYTTSSDTYERGCIQQIDNGDADDIQADGLIDLQASLKQIYQGNATWLMKRLTFGSVLKISGTNFYRFLNLQPTGDNKGVTLTLLGRPVVFADDMPTAVSAALPIAYGDFKSSYTITNRSAISTIVDPYTKPGVVKTTAFKRMGGQVTNFDGLKLLKMA